ncbi:MAG TPA: glycosyltransferase family 4 protein [Nitrospiraceae bacterium]|jgi:glycosyltransferase involved in cell wall biosynthesis|nr:glycosyltransferase family 4 protein [Nitrospiraceae bacterium]
MKVLVISGAFPPMQFGEATNALHLCQHLADRKLDVHVLTSHSNAVVDDPRIKIYPIMRRWCWSEIWHFGRVLKQCSPDVVLLMYIGGAIYNYHPMITFAPTIAKSLLPRVPFVTRFESAFATSSLSRIPFLRRAVRKGIVQWAGVDNVDYEYGTLLRDSDRIAVLCEFHRAVLAERSSDVNRKSVLLPPPPNMRISPENNGVSRKRGREMLAVRPDEFLVAYLGYIYPKKGLETLLRAFQIVRSQRDDVRLVLIGGSIDAKIPDALSYFDYMRELAKQLRIDDKTIWTGDYSWDSHEVSFYLYASDACVLPFNEGVHLNNSSFSSAATHGLPIITTQGVMLDQAFIHNENVLLCPPKDPGAVADAIKLLLDNPDLCRRLRTGARNLAQEWFSWEKTIDRTIATFSVQA